MDVASTTPEKLAWDSTTDLLWLCPVLYFQTSSTAFYDCRVVMYTKHLREEERFLEDFSIANEK